VKPLTIDFERNARASRLLDRDRELAAIGPAVDDVQRGGSLVYLEAAGGLGKSRLIAAACKYAADAQLLVLSARATELEQGFPFGLARQLFAAHVPADRAERSRVLGGAAAAAGRLLTGKLHSAPADPTRIG